jgi:hypothetical protein
VEINGNKKNEKNEKNESKNFQCEFCNKIYKSNAGLWKHKQKCNSQKLPEHTNNTGYNNSEKELMLMLIKENSELKNMVLDVCQKIQPLHNTVNSFNVNSNNKTFNLNVFLNEYCKDAMNITEFIDSLQLQLLDLENVGKLGFIDGISNIIVKSLISMDETKRPIHCTDKKREILYVKDEDKWEKENEQKMKIRKAIKSVVCKNQKLIPQFREKYPGYKNSESKYSDQYNKLVIEALGGAGDNEKEKEDKIIKNIAKEVLIDKITY